MKKQHNQRLKQRASFGPAQLPTFLDHVYELRRRLFWVVLIIIVASSAAYPFLDAILGILTKPLGTQQLYYLTPVGGLSFSIKLCMYVGTFVALPVAVYHLYRYFEPLMHRQLRKSSLLYMSTSAFFAAIGVVFAYFISLPSALKFLTGLNLANIQAMLTVDSYLTFVMTYLLGAAVLFQIPLILLIINTITPLRPSKLMGAQRYAIVAAFIVAAIISPTPDILNQAMLAGPIIAMFELGICFVWAQNSRRTRKQRRINARPTFVIKPMPVLVPAMEPAVASPSSMPSAPITVQPQPQPENFATPATPIPQQQTIAPTPREAATRTAPLGPPQRTFKPRRTVDGFGPRQSPRLAN
jgi:sec-independent protein translocase protein TatC